MLLQTIVFVDFSYLPQNNEEKIVQKEIAIVNYTL